MSNSHKIVLPWDFSKHAHMALEYAMHRFTSNDILALCVLKPPNPYESGMNWGPQALDQARASCTAEFFESVEYAQDSGLQFFAEFGEPATQIANFAKQHEADFIVISTHGRTGVVKLLMGSVAQKLSSESDTPIILLPAKWFAKNKDVHDRTARIPTAQLAVEPTSSQQKT